MGRAVSAWRSRIVWLTIAIVLLVVGGVLLGVGLASQRHAPQPTAAQAHPRATATSMRPTATVSSSATPKTTHRRTTPSQRPPGAARSRRPNPGLSTAAPTYAPPLVLARSIPRSIAIPSIGVQSSLLQLGLNPNRSIQVPPLDEKISHAGWYKYSPTPGQLGPAVILGHVDSAKYGAAIFFKLGALQPGATVDVTLADGKTAVFTVDRVVSYPKSSFPTDAVYGGIDHAGLRLITCGGTFDPAAGSYESNIVAYASLASSHSTTS